jgi:transketolase C-terminal domain/subunit
VLKPFDDDAVVDLAQRHRVLHCVENHSTVGGLAAGVSAAVAALGLGARVVAHGIPDRWAEYGRMDFNRSVLGLDAVSIAAAVEREIT